jgi:hypothetical protein
MVLSFIYNIKSLSEEQSLYSMNIFGVTFPSYFCLCDFLFITVLPWKILKKYLFWWKNTHTKSARSTKLAWRFITQPNWSKSVFHWQTFIRTIKQSKFAHRSTRYANENKASGNFSSGCISPISISRHQQSASLTHTVCYVSLFGAEICATRRDTISAAVREYIHIRP